MKNRPILSISIAMAGLALIAAACDDGPTRPGGTDSQISRLELSGPSRIGPGESGHYTLTAFLVIGGTRDVSDRADWRATNPAIVRLDKGLATGVAAGDGFVNATYSGRTSTKALLVTPSGTFRLKGTVTQSGSTTRVYGARVETRSPGGDVQQTTTGADGSFVLFGVPPESELSVSHLAYVEEKRSLRLTDDSSVAVQLTLSDSPLAVAGTYTLTIGSPTCPGIRTVPGLPEPLRQRTYTAEIRDAGNRQLEVTLSGAPFGTRPGGVTNRFSGYVQGGRVQFYLFGPDDYYYYYYSPDGPAVAERLNDDTYLVYSGFATVDVVDNGMRGTLNGSIRNSAAAVKGTMIARCSGTFPFVLTK